MELTKDELRRLVQRNVFGYDEDDLRFLIRRNIGH